MQNLIRSKQRKGILKNLLKVLTQKPGLLKLLWYCGGNGGDSMKKIIKNAIQCKLCGEIIESTYRHNLVACKCGACYVDGGHDYLRRGFNEEGCFIELSEYEEVPEETIDS